MRLITALARTLRDLTLIAVALFGIVYAITNFSADTMLALLAAFLFAAFFAANYFDP